jgi:hypothetical protein
MNILEIQIAIMLLHVAIAQLWIILSMRDIFGVVSLTIFGLLTVMSLMTNSFIFLFFLISGRGFA